VLVVGGGQQLYPVDDLSRERRYDFLDRNHNRHHVDHGASRDHDDY
jgi:hypothetical protein